MYANDGAAHTLGIKVVAIGPGTATTEMTVKDTMVNGYNSCHGGIIFTLADSALGYASNTRNQISMANDCSISFTAPGKLGAKLTANAREIWRSKRSAIYDVEVTSADGEIIAEFRGKSRNVPGTVL